MTGQKLYIIRVKGIVQGVFFRKTTQQKASELGLKGFIKNKNDGSVYIEAQGTEESLKGFLEWCHQGPPRAEVESVEFVEGALGEFDDFTIKR